MDEILRGLGDSSEEIEVRMKKTLIDFINYFVDNIR